MNMYQRHLFAHLHALLSRPLVVSRALGCGAGPRVHHAQVWVPAGLRGARSERSKARDAINSHGIAFRLAEPRRAMETPQLNVRK